MLLDREELKKGLEDYYGTAVFSGMPAAMGELSRISHASDRELVELAQKAGLNLKDYEAED